MREKDPKLNDLAEVMHLDFQGPKVKTVPEKFLWF